MRVLLAVALAWLLLRSSGVLGAPSPEWVAGNGFRYRDVALPLTGRTHLTSLPASVTGIAFRSDVAEERGAENSIRLAGTGVAAGDVDGDGWCDLFFCSMGGRSALYRNLGGWRFEDVTASAGVACEGQDSTGVVFADVDGDGDLDLLVNSIGGGARLFLNDGKGHFTEAGDSGLGGRHGSISLALADIDGNGTLDLYVANYAKTKIEDRPNTRIQTKTINGQLAIAALDGVPITSPELTNRYYIDAEHTIKERGEADLLYLNDGHGKFAPVSWTGGAFSDEAGQPLPLAPYDWGLSAMFRDLDGDGAPDLYVCNDLFSPDRIWLNDGRGHFRAIPSLAIRQTSMFSMGIDFADINRDGLDDFLVVDMLSRRLTDQKIQTVGARNPTLPIGKIDNRPQYKRNTLFLNRGDGTYAEIGQLGGLEATGWSWSPVFMDVDLDGYEDVLVTTGYYRDSLNADAIARMRAVQGKRKLSDAEFRELKKLFPTLRQQNRVYRNRGDLTFEEKTDSWGFDYLGISQGICLADLDNDGDLDVIVVPQNAPALVYRNDTAAARVGVRLKGKAPNTQGIGAKIRFVGGPVDQSQEMVCGGRYLCGDEAMRTFAAGGRSGGSAIEVTWRDGTRSVVSGVRPNRVYEIDQAGASLAKSEAQAPVTPLFEDASGLLNHVHAENEFDDFARQPSLPQRLGQLGPGVSWVELDGNGALGLAIGAGQGGRLAVFQSDGRGGFTKLGGAGLDEPIPRDLAATLGYLNAKGQAVLLSGFANYEDGLPGGQTLRTLDLRGRTVDELAAPMPGSLGPLALADTDGDGELDLFAGGRVVPGRFPEASSSWLFRGKEGRFIPDAENNARLANVGLVSGAVFSDLDGDGYPELILACQWGPVRVFHNERGQFTEATERLGLSRHTGWWNGVAAGDFDGDGRMDFVASNWGRNTRYQSYRERPVRLYWGEPVGGGTPVCVLANYDAAVGKWFPRSGLGAMTKAIPGLTERYNSQKSFGSASVEELFAGEIAPVKILEAAWLDTTVFLNRGDHFEARALPVEAQFAPAFGVSVADFDGDGFEDVFLSQNFFAVDGDTARYDAGRGLLLRGDGKGGFASMPGQSSGVKIYGDQRGSAVADYDGDGRADLAVAQNGAATVLLHNVGARPGLRVRLNGSVGGRGIGASLRLGSKDQWGPAREVRAGGGYWSQDGAVQVLAAAFAADRVWVRWPGGKTTSFALPPNVREVSLAPDGTAKKVR